MKDRLVHILAPIGLLIMIIILLEIGVNIFEISPLLLPPPSSIFKATMEHANEIAACSWNSFIIAISGFALSLIIGVFIALIMAQSRLVERSLYPYALFFQCVPIVALAPIFILWFGYGAPAMIIISFVISLLPIITSTVNGLTSVKKEHLEMMSLYGANPLQTLFKIRLPVAVPYIITGARVSAGLSVVGAIVGEYFTGRSDARGIAYLIRLSEQSGNTPYLFATTLAATLLGLIIFSLTGIISQIIIKKFHFQERR